MIRVNLIPQHRRTRAEARRRRAAWARLLRAYAVILACACALALVPAHAAPPSLESSIARVNRNIEATRKVLDDLKGQTSDLSRRIEIARIVGDHPDWSRALTAIAHIAAGPADGAAESRLRTLDLSIVRVEDKSAKPAAAKADKPAPPHDLVVLKLAGDAPNLESCLRCVKSLEDLGVFDQVTLKDTRAAMIGQMPATAFDIEATIDCGALQAAHKAGGAP